MFGRFLQIPIHEKGLLLTNLFSYWPGQQKTQMRQTLRQKKQRHEEEEEYSPKATAAVYFH